ASCVQGAWCQVSFRSTSEPRRARKYGSREHPARRSFCTAAASLSADDAAAGVGAPGIEYIGAVTSGDPGRGRDAAELDAHCTNHGFVIRPAEDGTAGDKRIGPRLGDAADVLRLDAPVDLEPDVAAGGVDQFAGALDFAQCRVDEALTAESRVDAHDEHQIDLV